MAVYLHWRRSIIAKTIGVQKREWEFVRNLQDFLEGGSIWESSGTEKGLEIGDHGRERLGRGGASLAWTTAKA